MSVGGVAAFDIFNLHGNYTSVVYRKNPVDRTCKTQIIASPAHGFPEGDRKHKLLKNTGEQIGRLLAWNGFPGAKVFAFLRGDGFQLGDFHSLSPGKSQGGFCRLTVFIKSGLFSGTQLFNGLIILLRCKIRYVENQTARCRQTSYVVKVNSFLRQGLADDLFHVNHGFRQKTRRNFFSADFKKQFVAHFISSSSSYSLKEGIPVLRAALNKVRRQAWPDCAPARYSWFARPR